MSNVIEPNPFEMGLQVPRSVRVVNYDLSGRINARSVRFEKRRLENGNLERWTLGERIPPPRWSG